MFDIYKNFELQATIKNFESMVWRRRYNKPGDFALRMPATRENIDLIRSGDIICLKGNQEGAFIQNITSSTISSGEKSLEISGYFLSFLFSYRKIDHVETLTAKNHITQIANQNYINPVDSDRKIKELRLLSFSFTNDKSIALEFEQRNGLDCVYDIVDPIQAGYKIIYNIKNKSYDIVFYEGVETDALFCEKNKNILTQDYYELTANEKNVCYVKRDDEMVVVGNATGLDRKETAIGANTTSIESLSQQGQKHLESYKIVKSFDTVIDGNNPQYVYRKDWDLGDIVANESGLFGNKIKKNVLEVTESYDKGGVTITPIFGDLIPQI